MEKEKTINEIAREAMDAIKKSEINKKNKDEEEAKKRLKIKEEALKEEIKNKIKRKLRRLEKEESKKPKVDEIDTRYTVSWSNPDGKGIKYIGKYNDSNLFEINRGITLFHLKIISKEILHESWRTNAHTSIYIDNLKEKADKLLKESNKTKEKINKKLSK